MKGPYIPPCNRVILFSRYPIPGKTKTRLIPALGPAGAADLQRRLTEKTLMTVREMSRKEDIEVEVRFEGGNRYKVRRWLGSDIRLNAQGPGDLGDRMHSAFVDAFKKGCRRVVVLGADIPDLGTLHLKEAFDGLKDNDLILGPSTDGGYWLIGLKRPVDLFKGIAWGTGAVLDSTVTKAHKQGLSFRLLDLLADMDTVEDLRLWKPEEADRKPYVSLIIPVLNEEEHIKSTIRDVQIEDAEVIVVDGGSTDHTVELARAAGAQVIKGPKGRAGQQNLGAEASRGKVLLFLHADTRLPGGFVKHVFEALMDPHTIAGAFRFKTDFDTPLMKAIEFLTNFRSTHLNLPYGDQGLFIPKPVFDRLGGFPDVEIAEDLFFVRGLAKQGRIRIAPAHTVTSGRRWRRLGPIRVTLVNQIIIAGYLLGVSHKKLKSLHRIFNKEGQSLNG